MISVYVLAVVASLLISALFRAELQKAKLARKTWKELLEELRPVNTDGIALAAIECSDEDDSYYVFAPHEIWTMIGGEKGLNRMQANAQLLIALAAHAMVWNFGGSLAAAEQMRRDGRTLYWAVWRIRFKQLLGQKDFPFPSDALESACTYYRMTERLVALYEGSPSRRYEQLTAAVWSH